ncbi:phosphate/phosphite/phosphonate ABC transporter substrate-binding protein [Kaarinaea lacus]
MQVRSLGRCIRWFVLCWFAAFVTPLQADIIFAAPPQYSEETAREIYGPLIRYLELIIGETVVFEYPSGWREYSKNMREDHYDIVFDAPHFSSWRMKHIEHEAVVRLPGTLGYVVVTNQDEQYINSLRDLVSSQICSLASPNLSTMTVYRLFDNPVNMPQIKEIDGTFNDVYQALKERQCKAAVLREADYDALAPEEQKSIKVIAKSEPMPERTITVSRRLRTKKRIITMMLTSVEGSRAGENIFREYGKQQQEFIPVTPDEYKDLDSLLSHVVWGW